MSGVCYDPTIVTGNVVCAWRLGEGGESLRAGKKTRIKNRFLRGGSVM